MSLVMGNTSRVHGVLGEEIELFEEQQGQE